MGLADPARPADQEDQADQDFFEGRGLLAQLQKNCRKIYRIVSLILELVVKKLLTVEAKATFDDKHIKYVYSASK